MPVCFSISLYRPSQGPASQAAPGETGKRGRVWARYNQTLVYLINTYSNVGARLREAAPACLHMNGDHSSQKGASQRLCVLDTIYNKSGVAGWAGTGAESEGCKHLVHRFSSYFTQASWLEITSIDSKSRDKKIYFTLLEIQKSM